MDGALAFVVKALFYLCDGNIDRALELHEWNLMLGRVLMGDIAHFELALRNAYDRALTERFQGDEHWLFDADMLSLFKALSPLAYESLHGNEKKRRSRNSSKIIQRR